MAVIEREIPVAEPATPPRKAIVEARSVDKHYDTGQLSVHALREIPFSVGAGEMVAITTASTPPGIDRRSW